MVSEYFALSVTFKSPYHFSYPPIDVFEVLNQSLKFTQFFLRGLKTVPGLPFLPSIDKEHLGGAVKRSVRLVGVCCIIALAIISICLIDSVKLN